MKRDFKEAVMNMLFEPDTDEAIIDAPLENVDVSKPPVVKAEPKKEEINVKEMIYGDRPKKSLLIDVDANKTVEKAVKPVVRNEEMTYEAQPNLSPIFGVIRDERIKTVKEVAVDETQTKKPRSSYLGTVLSPIFGYDTDKANEARISYQETDKKDSAQEEPDDPMVNTDVTEDLYDFFDDSDKTEPFIEEMINDDMAEEIDLFEDLFGDKKY